MLPALRDRFFSPSHFRGANDIFENLFRGFDDIFDDVRYKDKDGNVVYEIEVPGFNKENLSVDVADGILTISGERKVEGEYVGQRKIYKRLQIARSEEVDAEIKDGILYLVLKQPIKEKTKINIK